MSVHDLIQIVERQLDPVIRDPALRKIIGADFFRTVAGSDLAASQIRFSVMPLLQLQVIELGTQEREGFILILQLGPLGLGIDDNTGWQMRQPYRRVRRIDALSAVAGRPCDINSDVSGSLVACRCKICTSSNSCANRYYLITLEGYIRDADILSKIISNSVIVDIYKGLLYERVSLGLEINNRGFWTFALPSAQDLHSPGKKTRRVYQF